MKKALLLMTVIAMFVISCGGKKEAPSNVIKIGFAGPLTGDTAQYGTAVEAGLKMKIEEINAAGGISGKKLELISQDTKGDVNESVNIFKKLIN